MAEKKSEFQVVDKRKFTSEGEVRPDSEEQPTEPPRAEERQESTAPETAGPQAPPEAPPSHSPQDHAVGREAYAAANKGMDSAFQAAGIRDFDVTYERFMTQLYMTALYQLGMLRDESGPPRVDLIGARQTIDTLEMLVGKTKGNVTEAEERFVQDRLYELHMAYLEVTQALARASTDPNAKPPQQG